MFNLSLAAAGGHHLFDYTVSQKLRFVTHFLRILYMQNVFNHMNHSLSKLGHVLTSYG